MSKFFKLRNLQRILENDPNIISVTTDYYLYSIHVDDYINMNNITLYMYSKETLKCEYQYYEYNEIMKKLKEDLPERDFLLIQQLLFEKIT